ncbi:RagB/SusD family nutrient uptake outer membrane protein [Bacteroides fragilis]|nr:RagB/SusD family nutrient uptake outer membrane protein [Bacteroides fragilis]
MWRFISVPWNKFHGSGEYKSYLQIAKEASKRLIDSKEYSLYADYRNLFLLPGEDSNEHILSFRYSAEADTYNPRIRATIADLSHSPTKVLADAFLCKDGLPLEKSAYRVEYLPAGKEFENRDPRMALTIWKPGDPFLGKPFVPNLTSQTRTGYMFKKYGDEESYSNMKSRIDEILIRYAEVLLTFAEASFELDDRISDEDLNLSVNALRNRFEGDPNRLPDLTNAFVAEHGLSMRDEIRRERRVELAAESFRYDDIIRWKTAETELPAAILGAKFDPELYPSTVPGKDVILDKNGFILVQNAESRTFDSSKDYLFPLPLREVSLNPNLKQNPNW